MINTTSKPASTSSTVFSNNMSVSEYKEVNKISSFRILSNPTTGKLFVAYSSKQGNGTLPISNDLVASLLNGDKPEMQMVTVSAEGKEPTDMLVLKGEGKGAECIMEL